MVCAIAGAVLAVGFLYKSREGLNRQVSDTLAEGLVRADRFHPCNL